MTPLRGLIKVVPLKETPNGTFPDIDLKISSHEQGPNELKIEIDELGEHIMNVQ